MFKGIQKLILAIFSVVAISSCSNKPPIVHSNLPLVSDKLINYALLPEDYQKFLNSPNNNTMKHNNNHLVKAKSYVSAMGVKCYKLSLINASTSGSDFYTVCKYDESWYFIPDTLNKNKTMLTAL